MLPIVIVLSADRGLNIFYRINNTQCIVYTVVWIFHWLRMWKWMKSLDGFSK